MPGLKGKVPAHKHSASSKGTHTQLPLVPPPPPPLPTRYPNTMGAFLSFEEAFEMTGNPGTRSSKGPGRPYHTRDAPDAFMDALRSAEEGLASKEKPQGDAMLTRAHFQPIQPAAKGRTQPVGRWSAAAVDAYRDRMANVHRPVAWRRPGLPSVKE